ncbi:MAG: hypothetical protein Athens071425_385 [Parcubacteria group bacterium Athens0714_25]|nr:MAG: hypothetical protein Athens071425_385 [Parcubacteria group bacterium Athens0714_25]
MSGNKANQKSMSFPVGMLVLAIIFDGLGLVPFLNIVTEAVAGFIFGIWQRSYVPKTSPLMTFVIAKVIDFFFLGMVPSNCAIVVFAHMKRKAEFKLSGEK